MVQWLGLGALTAGALGSVPGQGTKMLQGVCDLLAMTATDMERSTRSYYLGCTFHMSGRFMLNTVNT